MKFLEYVNKYKNYLIGGIVGLAIGVTIGVTTEQCNIDKHAKWEKEDIGGQLISANLKLKDAEPWFNIPEEDRDKIEYEQKYGHLTGSEEVNGEVETSKDNIKEVELSPGHYISGDDFEPGKYNVVAISGGGNAISSNSSDGGINEVMNSDGSNGRIKEFNNVTLPSGTEFKVLGSLKVKLVPVK
ncbi:MAG: hypothetical protein E6902_14495 [Paeniclostridium sordellii]|nr:hypothetical protein [Paeniclostridium sordellii]